MNNQNCIALKYRLKELQEKAEKIKTNIEKG